ncbi:CDP-diacylglycerol--glycerol-3-phosphate 3-phosphatidyltransferase [Oscillatoria sp. CS-180]|uniref:CDP-diacylglycerol--glycerol-3-phosphate 3-phosphatidyltransferase n=1 Tax=Oscillatoria sp. CS-180 TaxID=3021720 RepID=UPI0023305DC9|nr:CDP-diacylglycerol--glycerol-3-phosphate 3-phosphatidyltransferase [Oscillatoria sp. CS-180]MDB9525051.1 CDP-diacylglycerol--glycerol-3-phosphate 3-phosphatidyltransferase [Oscillatoria sp. CS-180]
MNLPTWITVSRLLGVPAVLILLLNPTPYRAWIAVGVFLVAASTDWVDGYLARRLDQVTDLGKFLDPLVDKLLVLAPLLALIELDRVPAWGVFLILARELAISGWRVNPAFQSQSVPGANIWGKAKTVLQITAIAFLMAPLPITWQPVGLILFWLSVLMTWISGILYVVPRSQPQS